MSVELQVDSSDDQKSAWGLVVFLLDRDPPDAGRRFEITQSVQIGRHAKNDIVLDFDRVSRFHATIFFDGRRWQCACIGSNGMYLSGVRVAHAEVSTGVVLQFAKNGPRLLFEFDAGEAGVASHGSMTQLIEDLKRNCEDTSMKLWSRCFAALTRLARQRLRSIPRRSFDEEDVASRVLTDLFAAAQDGKLEDLTNRQSLWRLLITMTSNIAGQAMQRERRQKRGGGRVRGDSIDMPLHMALTEGSGSTFDRFASNTPTPDAVAAIDELMQVWLKSLETNELRDIALLKLEGATSIEIAEATQLPMRTVERRLQTIRTVWQKLSQDQSHC